MDSVSKDVLFIIFNFLDNKDLFSLSYLNKKFNQLVFSQSVWNGRKIRAQKVKFNFNDRILSSNIEVDLSYFDMYQASLMLYLKDRRVKLIKGPDLILNRICPIHCEIYDTGQRICNKCKKIIYPCCIEYVEYEIFCYDCASLFPRCRRCLNHRKELLPCVKCGELMCKICTDKYKDTYLCRGCGIFCSCCGKVLILNEQYTCNYCYRVVCGDHISMIFSDLYCNNCTQETTLSTTLGTN